MTLQLQLLSSLPPENKLEVLQRLLEQELELKKLELELELKKLEHERELKKLELRERELAKSELGSGAPAPALCVSCWEGLAVPRFFLCLWLAPTFGHPLCCSTCSAAGVDSQAPGVLPENGR